MLLFWTFYNYKILKKVKTATKILSSTTVFTIDNKKKVSWGADQHTRMIYEGSCDTEDWSNNAENSDLHHRNKLQFKIFL